MTFQNCGWLLRSPTRGEIAEKGDPFSQLPCPTVLNLADPFGDEFPLICVARHRIWRRRPSYALFLYGEMEIGETVQHAGHLLLYNLATGPSLLYRFACKFIPQLSSLTGSMARGGKG